MNPYEPPSAQSDCSNPSFTGEPTDADSVAQIVSPVLILIFLMITIFVLTY